MRGQAEVSASGGPIAWRAAGPPGVVEGSASLRAVERVVWAIRAERGARVIHEQRAADGYRRLMRAVLVAAGAAPEIRTTVTAEQGR